MKNFKYISIIMVLFTIVAVAAPPPLTPDTIVIDNQRSLQINNSTVVTLDRRTIQGNVKKEQGGTGFFGIAMPGYIARLVYTSGGNQNTGGGNQNTGGLSNLDLQNFVVGPVTNNNEGGFKVLSTSVATDENSIIVGTGSISEIAIGKIVAVSGAQSSPNGPIDTSRIEVLADDFSYWLLTGKISNLQTDSLDIGEQRIILSVDTTNNCGDVALENDLKIIVELTPKSDFSVGDDLNATSIYCFSVFDNPPVVDDNIVFFSGGITMVNDTFTQIIVNDVLVNLDANTQINGGTLADLVVGVEVQVDGIFNADTNEVTATLISLPPESVSASAPVAPEDVTLSQANTSDGTIIIMGITVKQNALTYDQEGIFSSGLTEETIVAFLGYKDNQGTIWASTVFKLPSGGQGQGLGELHLQGKAESLDSGNLIIEGVNVNTTGGTFFDNRVLVTEAEFIASLSIGDLIRIDQAVSYDKATNTLTGGTFNNFESFANNRNKSSNATITGSGKITRVFEDLIFRNTF